MNQQEAQNYFNEKLKAYQESTQFDNPYVAAMHPQYLVALRGLSIMALKVSVEDYKASLEEREFYNLKIAGLILHVVEKSSPDQLGVSLEDYTALMTMCADAATAWQEAVRPYATALQEEAGALIEAEKKEPLPKVKELYKKKKPQAEA